MRGDEVGSLRRFHVDYIKDTYMKGNEKVISELNAALSSELTAIAQYMVQAEMCQNWGYKRLGDFTNKRAIEEMKHAEGLIERILYLDGMPEVSIALKPQIGKNVKEQLEIDLKDELDASVQYNNSVKICHANGDGGSRELFEHMIQDEERHADWLESQLQAISDMGIGNYLAEQVKE
jgi:bacterioferritin